MRCCAGHRYSARRRPADSACFHHYEKESPVSRTTSYSRVSSWRHATILLPVFILFGAAATVTAQETEFDPESYNPRFEIGIGGGGAILQSPPSWSGDQYVDGRLSLAMRIIDGILIQGGKSIGQGSDPGGDWFDYGPHYRLNATQPGVRSGTWAGVRVDVPMTALKHDFLRIQSILISGGLVWDEYDIRGEEQEFYRTPYGYRTGESPDVRTETRRDRAADMDGYYVSLAARWRLNPAMTANPDSWYGYYGLDAGLMYTRYTSASLAHDTLMDAPTGFSGIQLFVNLYVKIDLLF